MNLLSLSEEVMEANLLPLLGWNDLLRFRRVCKSTRDTTTKYLRSHPELAPELELNDDDKTFGAFLNMDIPSTKLFVNNQSGFEFYSGKKREKKIRHFLTKYGSLVTSLKVKQLSVFLFGKEMEFLEGFTNLKTFEATFLGVGKETLTNHKELAVATKKLEAMAKRDPRFPSIPGSWRQLSLLKIGQLPYLIVDQVVKRTFSYWKFCTEVEHLSLPFSPFVNDPKMYEWGPEQVLGTTFSWIRRYIMVHPKEHPGSPNLKTFDFTCYHDEFDLDEETRTSLDSRGSPEWLWLCGICLQEHVKLLNVSPEWFQVWGHPFFPQPQRSVPEIGRVVVSMVNIQPWVFPLDMTNLEKIDIRGTSKCRVVALPGEKEWKRPQWPALKSLDILVDCKQVTSFRVSRDQRQPERVQVLKTRDLLDFLFKGIRREALTELKLKFKRDSGVELAWPKTEDVVAACPNLKKLSIGNWQGTNKALVGLWRGLGMLEEVCLEGCRELGNVAFVGEDRDKPAFLELKKLKKLTLKGIDKMPKITDTLFLRVIRHLELTHLIITSDEPVNKVSRAGVESLLEGPFASSIEKFPFRDWKLAGVSAEEWKQLEQKFRSYNML